MEILTDRFAFMTVNWLIEDLRRGEGSFVGGSVGLFRVAFATSLLIKLSVETWRGHHSYFDDERYLALWYQLRHPNERWLTGGLWRLLWVSKVVAAVLLLLGVWTTASLLVLIAALGVELRVYFKYHSNFMLLVCIGLLFSRSLGRSFSLWTWWQAPSWRAFLDVSQSAQENVLVPAYVMATIFALYGFGALHKCNAQFRTGRIVATTMYLLTAERQARRFLDFALPARVMRALVDEQWQPTRALSSLMQFVIAAEFLIPIGLVFDKTALWAMAAGLVMHLGFLALLPTTLLDFSVATLSTYVLFINPMKLRF